MPAYKENMERIQIRFSLEIFTFLQLQIVLRTWKYSCKHYNLSNNWLALSVLAIRNYDLGKVFHI